MMDQEFQAWSKMTKKYLFIPLSLLSSKLLHVVSVTQVLQKYPHFLNYLYFMYLICCTIMPFTRVFLLIRFIFKTSECQMYFNEDFNISCQSLFTTPSFFLWTFFLLINILNYLFLFQIYCLFMLQIILRYKSL